MREEALRVAVFPASHSTMSEWITSRQPTEVDEDKDGEVIMQRFPDDREATNGHRDALVAAAHVGPSVPWMHTPVWRPPSESDALPKPAGGPVTDEPPPEPPATVKVPRRFVSVTRSFYGDGENIIDAIADDGTAWVRTSYGWQPLPPLPDQEVIYFEARNA